MEGGETGGLTSATYTRASAVRGRDPLVAQAGFLELERLGRHAELQVRRAVEPGPDVLQVLLEVPERERHGPIVALQGFPGRTPVGRCWWATRSPLS